MQNRNEPTVFELTDAQGVSHEYRVVPYPAAYGVDLGPTLLTILAPLLGGIAGLATSGAGEGAREDAARMLAELESGGAAGGAQSSSFMDAEIDGEALERVLMTFARELASAGGSGLLMRLFKGVTRSNPAAPEERGQNLWTQAGFNAAYTQNYGEMFKAVAEVIKANFIPSYAGAGGQGIFAKLTALLDTLKV